MFSISTFISENTPFIAGSTVVIAAVIVSVILFQTRNEKKHV